VRDHYHKNYKRTLAENEFTLSFQQRAKLRDSSQVQFEQRETLRQIYISGQRLSGVHARILELRCFSGKSYSEIAAIMGGSCQNACVRLHRARKLLCKRLSVMAEEYC
jgi:DNA-directed RNA polymerase specialized sigma24 family protein